MEILKNFAIFEGCDGSGTTTQLALLSERLRKYAQNIKFFLTFEPTDGPIGKLIRSALRKETPVTPATLAMLFAADRNEHLSGENGIIQRVNRGELVICDRYTPSSLVYQGIDCGDDLPRNLNSIFPAPETLIFFDIDAHTAINRVKDRSSHEIYEYIEFQEKAREKYQTLLKIYSDAGSNVKTVDASKSPQDVADQVWGIISQMPILKTTT